MSLPDDNSAPILHRPLARFKIKLAEQLKESPLKLAINTRPERQDKKAGGGIIDCAFRCYF